MYWAYDAQSMAAVTHNLVNHLSLRTTGAFNDVFHISTPFSPYGIGVSLLLVPFYALSKVTGGPGFLQSLLNPIMVAATAAATYHVGRALSWPRRTSVLAALTFGCLTMALQSTTELFSEPGVGLCVALLVLAVVRWPHGWRWSPLVLGIAAGAAAQFRSDSVLTVWVGLLAVPLFVPRRVYLSGRALLSAGIPIVLSLAFLVWYDEHRFGKLLTTSYGGVGYHTPLLTGLDGLLLSSGKSIFLFNAIAIPGTIGLIVLLAKRQPFGILAFLLIVPRLLLFAKWDAWQGGLSWGPRFMMPVISLFTLCAFALLHVGIEKRWFARTATAAIVVAALVSVPISFVSVRVPYDQWWAVLSIPSLRAHYVATGRLVAGAHGPNIISSMDSVWVANPIRGDVLLLKHGQATMAPAFWREGEGAVGWLLLLGFAACSIGAIVSSGRSDHKRPGRLSSTRGGNGQYDGSLGPTAQKEKIRSHNLE
jgi:hypothetical protein